MNREQPMTPDEVGMCVRIFIAKWLQLRGVPMPDDYFQTVVQELVASRYTKTQAQVALKNLLHSEVSTAKLQRGLQLADFKPNTLTISRHDFERRIVSAQRQAYEQGKRDGCGSTTADTEIDMEVFHENIDLKNELVELKEKLRKAEQKIDANERTIERLRFQNAELSENLQVLL